MALKNDELSCPIIFVEGMAFAFEKVVTQMLDSQNKGEKDHSDLMRTLDSKQRKALELFQHSD